MAVTGWIISASREARSREQRLPDGSLVVLRGVTYGSTHRFWVGNLWQKMVARILPARFASRFPSLVYNDTNSGPTLVVWIEHVGEAAGGTIQNVGRPAKSEPLEWRGLFDDSGTEFGNYYPALSAPTGRGVVQGFVFHALPAASRILHFRFVGGDSVTGSQYAAVFTFRNPAFRTGAQKRTAYPLAVRQDKLSLVLNGFQPEPRRENHETEMGLSFDLFDNRQPANDWELHSLVVLDQNGGRYVPGTAGWGRRENHTSMSFAGGLSTNAPWRLRFCLKHATFLSNELCTVRGLPIVAESDVETELARVPFQGSTLVIRRTAGRVRVEATLVPPDEKYYLNFVDILAANGRPFDRGKTYVMGQSDTNYLMGFPPGVTNVDLTFGITRKVFIEVVAQPSPR